MMPVGGAAGVLPCVQCLITLQIESIMMMHLPALPQAGKLALLGAIAAACLKKTVALTDIELPPHP